MWNMQGAEQARTEQNEPPWATCELLYIHSHQAGISRPKCNGLLKASLLPNHISRSKFNCLLKASLLPNWHISAKIKWFVKSSNILIQSSSATYHYIRARYIAKMTVMNWNVWTKIWTKVQPKLCMCVWERGDGNVPICKSHANLGRMESRREYGWYLWKRRGGGGGLLLDSP